MNYLYAKSHNITQRFTYLSWSELVERITNPPKLGELTTEQAKKQSPVISAHNAPNKTKEAALEHDNFTLIRLDIDDTNLETEAIQDVLEGLSIASFAIHSTASHKQNGKGNRYRVYIEIASSLCFADWSMVETYLAYVFTADDCASRPQQIMYLPYLFDGYEYVIGTGEPLDVKNSELYTLAVQFKNQQDVNYQEQREKQIPDKKPYPEALIGKQVSIIDLVNQAYDWESLLLSYGYKRQGKAYLPPEASSKIAGAYILTSNTDGKERYYSHHASDPCSTGRTLDKFDFITLRSYFGNSVKALREIADEHFSDVSKHNKREWAVAKQNEQVKTGGVK